VSLQNGKGLGASSRERGRPVFMTLKSSSFFRCPISRLSRGSGATDARLSRLGNREAPAASQRRPCGAQRGAPAHLVCPPSPDYRDVNMPRQWLAPGRRRAVPGCPSAGSRPEEASLGERGRAWQSAGNRLGDLESWARDGSTCRAITISSTIHKRGISTPYLRPWFALFRFGG